MRVPSSKLFRLTLRGLVATALLTLVPVLPAHAFDTDADGVQDGVDNCPFAANAGQQDTGGIGSGSLPEGNGNACQCGDANGDGRVTLADTVVIQRSLLQPPTATLANPALCDVNGDGLCNIADSVVARRALLSPPTAAIQQTCTPTKAPVPNLVVTQPTFGAFIPPGPGNQCDVTFAGSVSNVDNADLDLLVGGVDVATVNSAFNTNRVIVGPLQSNVVSARRLSVPGFEVRAFKRVNEVVSCSDSVGGTTAALSGIGVRLNDRGIDRLEPVLNTEIANRIGNIGALVRSLSPIQVNQCVLDASLVCVINLDSVSISSAGLGAFGIGLDSQTNQVAANATATSLFANYQAEITGPNCFGTVTASSVGLTGGFALEPLASNRENVDVNLVSGPTIVLNNFQNNFTGGPCGVIILEQIINAIAQNQIRDTVTNGIRDALKDPDGGGAADSPLADAIESGLAGISLSGTIGSVLGINLDAPFAAISEDNGGITFRIDPNLNPTSVDPTSPQPFSSLKIASTFPTYGNNVPNTATPYGIAISIDPTTMNKLLRAETQKGTFKIDITTLNFDLVVPGLGLGTQVISTTNLSNIIPQFFVVNPPENVRIEARPQTAPAVLDPQNVVATEVVRAAGVQVDFVGVSSGKRYLRLGVDGDISVGVGIVANAIDVSVQNVGNLNAGLIEDNLGGVSQLTIDILKAAITQALATTPITQSLESIELPSVLGIGIVPRGIENDFNGNFLNLYLDLN